MRARSSETWRAFIRSCSAYSTCWYWQPPHTPKSAQRGSVRTADGGPTTSSRSASEWPLWLRKTRARTVSPGSVNGTITTQPRSSPSASLASGASCTRPTPSPRLLRSSMVTVTSSWYANGCGRNLGGGRSGASGACVVVVADSDARSGERRTPSATTSVEMDDI